MALIFAWTGGLRKRGEMDGTADVVRFADRLERAALATVEAGIMTGDLLTVARKSAKNRKVSTEGFIDAIAERLRRSLARSARGKMRS
jgi:isocitrate dehydrogenase